MVTLDVVFHQGCHCIYFFLQNQSWSWRSACTPASLWRSIALERSVLGLFFSPSSHSLSLWSLTASKRSVLIWFLSQLFAVEVNAIENISLGLYFSLHKLQPVWCVPCLFNSNCFLWRDSVTFLQVNATWRIWVHCNTVILRINECSEARYYTRLRYVRSP